MLPPGVLRDVRWSDVPVLFCRWPDALAMADDHMERYPPRGLKQPNLDTRHLAVKVEALVKAARINAEIKGEKTARVK